jgi:hypothetical protein
MVPVAFTLPPKLLSIKDGFTSGGDVLSSKHRMFKKNFETEVRVNSVRLPLNHFVQETLANMMVGFLRTLKGVPEKAPISIDISIKKLPKQVEVDAHTYP